MKVCTIGFTKKTAQAFFECLRAAGVDTLIDVRISNTSQLAGFAKYPDLPYFLDRLCGIAYIHDVLLAPTEQLLKDYRGKVVSWAQYEEIFEEIMAQRRMDAHIRTAYRDLADRTVCLLCSEPTPEQCHRRLVAAHFAAVFGAQVQHL